MICQGTLTPDFLAADFLPADFNTEKTVVPFAVEFKSYLFGLLPYYFKSEDSYKDNNGEGLLERYLSIFGAEIDEEVIPSIRCYLNIIDAEICEERFLTPLSDSLGNPPDVFQDVEAYRNLLSYIASFYKIKGTKESYELFFGILGYDVILDEIVPPFAAVEATLGDRYDLGPELQYDLDIPEFTYDQGQCEPCSQYDLTLNPKPGNITVITESLTRRINETIKFNEPINAILRNLTIN